MTTDEEIKSLNHQLDLLQNKDRMSDGDWRAIRNAELRLIELVKLKENKK